MKYRPPPGPLLAVRSYMYGHLAPSDFGRQRRLFLSSSLGCRSSRDLDNVRSSEPPIRRASTNEPESSGRKSHFGGCESFVGRWDAYPFGHGRWNGALVAWCHGRRGPSLQAFWVMWRVCASGEGESPDKAQDRDVYSDARTAVLHRPALCIRTAEA
jgi:hypothetical protein